MELQEHKCCDMKRVYKGAWTPEEDAILTAYMKTHGNQGQSWSRIATHAGLKRCGKSCRFRWLHYLSPSIDHRDFSAEEVEIICNLHKVIGNKWSEIAKFLPGRSDNSIKNFWNAYSKEPYPSNQNDQQLPAVTTTLTNSQHILQQDHHNLLPSNQQILQQHHSSSTNNQQILQQDYHISSTNNQHVLQQDHYNSSINNQQILQQDYHNSSINNHVILQQDHHNPSTYYDNLITSFPTDQFFTSEVINTSPINPQPNFQNSDPLSNSCDLAPLPESLQSTLGYIWHEPHM